MNRLFFRSILWIVVYAVLAPCGQTKAGVIYTNDGNNPGGVAMNGTIQALQIYEPNTGTGQTVSDSFSVNSSVFTTGGATLQTATIGLWYSSTTFLPAQVQWSIGTSPYTISPSASSNIASGTSLLTNAVSYGTNNVYHYHLETVQFSFSGSPINLLTGHTYYLTLSNAATGPTVGGIIAWDISNGSSVAYSTVFSGNGNASGQVSTGTNSNSFELDGVAYTPPPSVPEPTSLALMGVGVIVLVAGGVRRRSRNKTATVSS